MAKKNIHNNQLTNVPAEFDEVFDFMNDGIEEDYISHEEFSGVMGHIIEASNAQIKIAAELTNVILQHQKESPKTEQQILDLFKNAAKTVSESYPMKALLSQAEMD